MQIATRQSATVVWLQWSCVTTLSLAAGLAYLYRSRLLQLSIEGIAWHMGLFAVVAGFQWGFVLRRYFTNFAWWVYTTGFGWILATIAAQFLYLIIKSILGNWFVDSSDPMVFTIGNFIWGPVIGITFGVGQWLLLRKQIKWTIWWVLANIIGYGLGYAFIFPLYTLASAYSGPFAPVMPGTVDVPTILMGTLLGSTIIGTVTATAMTWLLQQNALVGSRVAHSSSGSID